MVAIYITIGFVAGAIIFFLIFRLQQEKLKGQNSSTALENQRLAGDNAQLATQNTEIQAQNSSLQIENARLKTQYEVASANIESLRQQMERERESFQRLRMEERENAEKLRTESDKQWQAKFDKMKEEFQNVAGTLLKDKQESLQESNKTQLDTLLKPIHEQFEAFRKSVEDSKTSNEVAKKELKDSFEATMKLFAQQQNQAVESLKKETAKIGNDANNLTNALKRDTKKQGNWGELILETILEGSGLVKDEHFFIQETVKDDEGNMLRPDVIVKFPEGKSIIIDSKVSLTAYADAFETDDDELRRRRIKDHARSVRKHVDELAGKKYDTVVTDAIGFVLMFIPNDQCYLSAIEEDPDLSRYAYHKGIVIISPSNLMMALQLAYNMWQEDLRNRNLDKIVKSATDLYEKVAGFSESMDSVEKNLSQLTRAFQTAKKQLYDGNGNIMKRVESLREYGINPKKQIKGLDTP